MTDSVVGVVVGLVILGITVLGFTAAGTRSGGRDRIETWALADRSFGTGMTWAVLGGSIYTAYTLVAVPAVVYSSGAVGFFALPYTVIIYPIFLLAAPRLWRLARRNGYLTAADFVRARHDSKLLSLAVALTGMLATMPYIALQMIGIGVVFDAMGVGGDVPVILVFGVTAAYTCLWGLRGPAAIAVVKAVLVFGVTAVLSVYVPAQHGGWGGVFRAADAAMPRETGGGDVLLDSSRYVPYASLALGSALALFLYPHVITGVLAARSERTLRRNSYLLPAWTLALGLLALGGYLAIAVGVHLPAGDSTQAMPALLAEAFPSWFTGLAYAAVVVGALVSADVMAVAAGTLFSRNVYRQFIRPTATSQQQTQVARVVGLLSTLGAMGFIIGLKAQAAINLQLLGGVWILQTLPAVGIGLFSRWFHRWALVAGWAAGMLAGTLMAAAGGFVAAYPISLGGLQIRVYPALLALALNLAVAAAGTVLLRALDVPGGVDATGEGRPKATAVAAGAG